MANLTKEAKDDMVDLETFLSVKSWFDILLSQKRKEEVEYEEDKEDIDKECNSIKTMIFELNSNSDNLLNIHNFYVVLKAEPLSSSYSSLDEVGQEEKRYMHLLFE
jgi:hypothetical protein